MPKDVPFTCPFGEKDIIEVSEVDGLGRAGYRGQCPRGRRCKLYKGGMVNEKIHVARKMREKKGFRRNDVGQRLAQEVQEMCTDIQRAKEDKQMEEATRNTLGLIGNAPVYRMRKESIND